MIYCETGQYPLHIVIKKRMICYWYKCLHKSNGKLTLYLYKLLSVLHDKGIIEFEWIDFVRNTLNSLGLSHVWIYQAYGINIDWLNNKIVQVCQDQFKQSLFSNIYNSRKCVMYRVMKQTFGLESYLLEVPIELRHYVTRFRCRSNKLPVEKGSFYDILYDERFCSKCDQQVIGDEFHVIFKCKFFNKERQLLLPARYQAVNSVLSLSDLFHSKGDSLICIAKFIKLVLRAFV